MHEAEIRILLEREQKSEILTNLDEGHSCVKALVRVLEYINSMYCGEKRNGPHIGEKEVGEKEVGEQVRKRVRQFLVLLQGYPDLFESERDTTRQVAQARTCFQPIVR